VFNMNNGEEDSLHGAHACANFVPPSFLPVFTPPLDSHRVRRYRARTHQRGGATTWTDYEMPPWRGDTSWGLGSCLGFEVRSRTGRRGPVTGRVSCLWNDGPGGHGYQHFEEARAFLPEWVAVTKAANGC